MSDWPIPRGRLRRSAFYVAAGVAAPGIALVLWLAGLSG